MSEGWEDCPVLPVGWKRREVYRRYGVSIGKSDTYYMSPTGERFRSKVEMVKYFGDTLDLTYFDFKKGIILPSNTKVRRSVKRIGPSANEGGDGQSPGRKAKTPPTPLHTETVLEKDKEAEGLSSVPLDTLIACCEGCQQWVPGVLFGPRKQWLNFYCADCRAKRREFGRKLNYYKRFGCGECAGCAITEDCGVCRGCVARSSGTGRRWKCVRRGCFKLKEIKAEASRRNTSGEPKRGIKPQPQRIKKMAIVKPQPVVHMYADSPRYKIAKRKTRSDKGVKKGQRKTRSDKGVKKGKRRRIHEAMSGKQEEEKVKPGLPVKEESPLEIPDAPVQLFNSLVTEDFARTPDVHSEFILKKSRGSVRNSRTCGQCAACQRAADCGVCDFCLDKTKFGGANTLRQKCRWKQCLTFASKRLLPREVPEPAIRPDCKETPRRRVFGRWKDSAFASRKVAWAIQAARKREAWQADLSRVEAVAEAEEQHFHPRTLSPVNRRELAGDPAVPSLAKEQRDDGDTQWPSPVQRKVPTSDHALNLKRFLSVMKPLLKGSSKPQTLLRPSVIRETSEWQLSGKRESTEKRPGDPPALQTSGVCSADQQDIPRSGPDRVPSTTALQEVIIEQPSHGSVSPVIIQHGHKDKNGSSRGLTCSTEKTGLNGASSQSVSASLEDKPQEKGVRSQRQPNSPKRPAEPESQAPATPCDNRIVRPDEQEQSPEYGRSPRTAVEGGQSAPSRLLEDSSNDPDDDSGLPVITQIFSLGSPYMMMTLEPLLRTFMQDLMLLALPASWVVCSSLGPDIRLIQLSRKSSVWDAVVLIQPGFSFQVLVRGLPVPPGHRLYRSHPLRLATADDVVDLVSDLETYRVCAGYPQLGGLKPPALAALLPRQRSSFCEVLVDKERCYQCAA